MSLIYLAEATVSGTSVTGPFGKIISYLESSLGVQLVRIPGVEHYSNSKSKGFGIRFVFSGKTKSIRFNWKSEGEVGKSTSISSVDVWDGSHRHATNHITLRGGESFVQALPQLATALGGKQEVTEAKKGEYTPEQALNNFINLLRKGKTFTRGDFASLYHMSNIDLFDVMVSKFSNQFVINGKRVAAKKGTDWEKLKTNVLSATQSMLNIDDGGGEETYEDDVDDTPAVSFADSLANLEKLVKGIVKGTFNALFVAGKGGTGKTQTVEKVLAEAGLRDGRGYFKNTGTATGAGIYSLLYNHSRDVVLFDDSDGALDDQDSRNIIKAATDTKKVRKLVWTKSGSISDEKGLIPHSFNYEGRIIFISNLSLDKLDPDKALRTRAFVIVIDPSNEEMMDYMETILPNIRVEGKLTLPQRKKVMKVVRTMGESQDINLRTLVRALNIAASGESDWENLVRLYA